MKHYSRHTLAWGRAFMAKMRGLDLSKSYYELSSDDITTLDWICQLCNYRGETTTGRSRLHQFWLHLQWGIKEWKPK